MCNVDDKLTCYQKLHLGLTALGWIVALGSLIGLFFQVQNVAEQNRKQTEAMQIQSFQVLVQTWAQIDHVFIQQPEMRPFFYESVNPEPGTRNYTTALGIAGLHLDLFEQFFTVSQKENEIFVFPGAKKSQGKAIENYMKGVFATSPILCETLAESRNWYSDELTSFAKEPCEKFSKTKK